MKKKKKQNYASTLHRQLKVVECFESPNIEGGKQSGDTTPVGCPSAGPSQTRSGSQFLKELMRLNKFHWGPILQPNLGLGLEGKRLIAGGYTQGVLVWIQPKGML